VSDLSKDQLQDYFSHFGAVEDVKKLSSTVTEVTFEYFASTEKASKCSIHTISGEKAIVLMLEPEFARRYCLL